MRQRVITAVIFAAAMLGGVYGGRYTFFALFAVITAGCGWELAGLLFQEENHRLARRIAGTVSAFIPYLYFYTSLSGMFPEWTGWFLAALFIFGMFLMTAIELFMHSKQPFSNIGHYLMCAFYVGLPFGLLADIAIRGGTSTYEGLPPYFPNRVFGLLLLIWTNDTMAYFMGSQFGRRKLFERISPKKTWEGTIGGGISTLLMAWGLSFLIKDFTPLQWLALGAVAAVFGTFGDLVESMLKRSDGVKDSGDLLPGHGGLFDRFDAFIFALPFFWLALMILGG